MRRCAAVLCALLPGAAPAPGLSPDAVPGVQSELVQVDVVVSDGHGRLVRDLAREDFVVLEDGKPQRVSQFLVAGRTSAPVPMGDTAAVEPGTGDPAAGPGRHVVILVDDLHIALGGLTATKQALARLVDELAPDDSVALVATGSPDVLQQFTRERAVLKQAIARLAVRDVGVVPATGSRMTPAQAELILRGDRIALQLATRTMIAEPGSKFTGGLSPQAAVGAPAGTRPDNLGPDSEAVEQVAEQEVRRQARSILAEALRFSVVTLGTIEDVVRSVSGLPGRKLCLLVSDGFLVGTGTSDERTRDLQRIVDAATRAGAVVYALDSRGLVPSGGDASVAGIGVPPGLQERVDRLSAQESREALQAVAGQTGGFLVQGSNDLAGGLRRMLGDNDSYYLMAYEPSNTRRDGRFRRIEVRLPGHRGFVVRTRRGYFAPDDRKRAGGLEPSGAGRALSVSPPAIDEAEARAALAAPLPENGVPLRLSADYVDLPPTGPQAVVRARVELAGIPWQEIQGRRRATLDLVGAVYDVDGRPVGVPFSRRAELDLAPAEYQRAMEAGLQYQQQLALKPGRYQVRMVARERTLSQLGGAAQWLEIPDLGDKKLAMSSVFLSSPAHGTSDAQTLRRFKRGGSVGFQLYVYNALADEEGMSDVVYQAQIFSGAKAIAASKPQPAALLRKDGAPVPEANGLSLEGLEPGSYELRVVVVDRKAAATIFRRVDFSVE